MRIGCPLAPVRPLIIIRITYSPPRPSEKDGPGPLGFGLGSPGSAPTSSLEEFNVWMCSSVEWPYMQGIRFAIFCNTSIGWAKRQARMVGLVSMPSWTCIARFCIALRSSHLLQCAITSFNWKLVPVPEFFGREPAWPAWVFISLFDSNK